MRLLLSLLCTGVLYYLAFVDGIEFAVSIIYWISWLSILSSFSETVSKARVKEGLVYNYVYSFVHLVTLYFMIKLNQPVIAVSALLSIAGNMIALDKIDIIRKSER